jgi:hypothetical protein
MDTRSPFVVPLTILGSNPPVSSELHAPGAVELVAGLRVWAAGYAADEAAVELLAAVADVVPSLLDPDGGWLVPCPRPGVWSIEGAALAEAVGWFPARLRPVITVAAALAVDGALVEVGTTLAAVPPPWLRSVFAALAHAAGCVSVQLVHLDHPEPGLFPVLDGAA